jgi:HlyD family secretion protein
MRFSASYLIAIRSGLLVGLFVFAAAQSGRATEPTKQSAVMVMVARATKACFSASIDVDGVIVARREALVVPEHEGLRIAEVLVAEGDRVAAGQELIRLKRPSGEIGPGPSAEVLHAPASGVVIQSTALVGETASVRAMPLFRMAIDGELEFAAEVLSIHLAQLSPGQTARIVLDDHRDLNGRVRVVPADVNPQTQLARVRLTVDKDPAVRVGTFGRAVIDAKRSCGIAVPRSAVLYRTGGATVQVVDDGVVETRHVRVGLASESGAEIREGVSESELIVANGGSSLRDGDKVRPIFADEIEQAGAR